MKNISQVQIMSICQETINVIDMFVHQIHTDQMESGKLAQMT